MDFGKFALSIWTQTRGDTDSGAGKRFDLGEDGELIKGPVSVWASEMIVDTFDNLEELGQIIEGEVGRNSFFTSGIPTNWREIAQSDTPIRVTKKSACTRAKRNSVQRTKDTLPGSPDIGTYFVVDFDTEQCPWEQMPDIQNIHERIIAAAKLGGVDLNDVQCLGYRSSSSSIVREADDHEFDKGGRHLIFLIEDASDYDRFRDALQVFLTLTGSSFCRIGSAGQFLQRGILDATAARLCQPTFMAPPVCGAGLRSERHLTNLGGNRDCIDTHLLRDPTPEEFESCETFWASSRTNLRPESQRRETEWRERKREELQVHTGETLSSDAIDELLSRRLCGILTAQDIVFFDNGNTTTVAEILADPGAYDGMTCADPIEPDLDHGRNKAICYANLETGQPIIFSHCGGGISYKLLHDSSSLLMRLKGLDDDERIDRLPREMKLLFTKNASEAEATMLAVSKTVGTTKDAIKRDFGSTIARIRSSRQRVVDEIDDSSKAPTVNSVEYQAAVVIKDRNSVVSTHGARGPELWSYTGTHWRRYYDAEAARDLLQTLSRSGWDSSLGRISKAAQDAVVSLKQQSFEIQPPFRKAAESVINCTNGEIWIDSTGGVELRPHSRDSGLTYVLDVEYDPQSNSPLLRRSLKEMFLRPTYERDDASDDLARQIRSEAEEMVDYMLEVLAYVMVPCRWQAAWFLFIGNGSNGKTLLMKLLQRLLPEETVVNERLKAISDDSFGMARLRDKTALIDDDLDTNITLPDGFLKKVSEAKRLSANVKHNPDDVSFDNRCAVVLLSNNFPRLMDVSFGTLRRIHVTEFPRQFYTKQQLANMPAEKREKYEGDVADADLLDKLVNELVGILSELVAAYSRLRKRGGFAVPRAAHRATNRALCMAHPLKQFVEKRCAIGRGRYVWRTEFQSKLDYYCNVEQKNKWSPTPQQIRTEMEQLGFPVKSKNVGGKVAEAYIGLSLKEQPPVQVAPETVDLPPEHSNNRRRRARKGDSG